MFVIIPTTTTTAACDRLTIARLHILPVSHAVPFIPVPLFIVAHNTLTYLTPLLLGYSSTRHDHDYYIICCTLSDLTGWQCLFVKGGLVLNNNNNCLARVLYHCPATFSTKTSQWTDCSSMHNNPTHTSIHPSTHLHTC